MFKLAWRNLWRNKRRTIITSLAVGFAVFLMVFMLSIEHGTYNYTKDYATKIWNGKARIFKKGYFKKETITKSFAPDEELKRALQKAGVNWCLRIDGFGLVSLGEKTYGVSISGVEPGREISRLREKVKEGRFLERAGEAVLGWRLARNLKASVGDKIAVLVQGRDGSLGAELFEVVGTFKSGVLELDRAKVLIPLSDADRLFSMGGTVTTVVIYFKGKKESEVLSEIKKSLPEGLEVVPWQKLMPELLEMIEFDRAGAYIMYFILILIVAFGLLNTLFMAAFERRKEIAVMRAVGIRKGEIRKMVMEEAFLISALGVIIGQLASLPLVIYFHYNPIKLGGKMAELYEAFEFAPIMPTLISWRILVGVAGVVFFFALFVALFPAFRITKEELARQLRFEK